MDCVLREWKKTNVLFAPKTLPGYGAFSDTDSVRYAAVSSVDEIEFTGKSQFTFKEILTPLSQTLFYFTEDEVKEEAPPERGAIVFLRSCDFHAVKRLDEIYLRNGEEDYYYKRLRDRVKFVVMGCPESFENCFCVEPARVTTLPSKSGTAPLSSTTGIRSGTPCSKGRRTGRKRCPPPSSAKTRCASSSRTASASR